MYVYPYIFKVHKILITEEIVPRKPKAVGISLQRYVIDHCGLGINQIYN
jgi:hypothetical protein